MKTRAGLLMIVATGLAVVSVGPSWAFDLESALQDRMERVAADTADKAARTLADKGVKVIDKTLSPSDQQTPSKNQSAPEATPPKADAARPNQATPQGKTGQ